MEHRQPQVDRKRNRKALEAELHSVFRNQPGLSQVNSRAADLSPASLDSGKRQVGVVATTEDPALVYDWSTGRVILEVLLMSGAEVEEQTPLLRDHSQWSVTSICGSFVEHKIVGDRLEGLITVGKDIDDTVEGIWRRIEQGHLRRVSIGYDYTRKDFVTIPADWDEYRLIQLENSRIASGEKPKRSQLKPVHEEQLSLF